MQINERLDRIAPCMTSGELIGTIQTDRPLSTPRETLKELVLSPLVSHDTRQAIMLFSALADELDAMRRYALLNFLAVAKVVKKHDKLSLLPLKATLSAFIADQPFLTGRPLQRAYSRMRGISTNLMATAQGSNPFVHNPRTCRCSRPLEMNFVYERRLRLCAPCLASAATYAFPPSIVRMRLVHRTY